MLLFTPKYVSHKTIQFINPFCLYKNIMFPILLEKTFPIIYNALLKCKYYVRKEGSLSQAFFILKKIYVSLKQVGRVNRTDIMHHIHLLIVTKQFKFILHTFYNTHTHLIISTPLEYPTFFYDRHISTLICIQIKNNIQFWCLFIKK